MLHIKQKEKTSENESLKALVLFSSSLVAFTATTVVTIHFRGILHCIIKLKQRRLAFVSMLKVTLIARMMLK